MEFLVLEPDCQKATFWVSVRFSKAGHGHFVNTLESVAALEAHALQRLLRSVVLLSFLQKLHTNFGASGAASST